MNFGVILKTLWKRHGWEACLFVGVSFLLSFLFWKGVGDYVLTMLSWLEVATLAWLVTRVSLTQLGFGTFGGWRVKPSGRGRYLVGEMVFLTGFLMLAGCVRILVVVDFFQPSPGEWLPLIRSWDWVLWGISVLYWLSKLVGLGGERDDAGSRPRIAWGVVLALVAGSLVLSAAREPRNHYRGGSNECNLDPRALPGVKDWQWLRGYQNGAFSAANLDLIKLPLREGVVVQGNGLRVELTEVQRSGETFAVHVEVTAKKGFKGGLPVEPGFMLAYSNGYFGGATQGTYGIRITRVPLLDAEQMIYQARFFSPLSLPENELSAEELLDGAELWMGIGAIENLLYDRDRRSDDPKNDEERFRWFLASSAGQRDELETMAFRGELDQRGREAMNELLAAAPWSEWGVSEIVLPYLGEFANESDYSQLLEMFERDPLLGDVFLERGWIADSDVVLRKHLESGKTLSKKGTIFLAKLGEEAMGPRLENQLLRMSGDFDDVIAVLQKHPGVDWDRVRRAAWDRMAAGFGSHRYWAKWGAEIGEKEALRILLIEAHSGKKWEREILEGWFGRENDVVNLLRENWDYVTFEDGLWTISESVQ